MRLFTATAVIYGFQLHWIWYLAMLAVWTVTWLVTHGLPIFREIGEEERARLAMFEHAATAKCDQRFGPIPAYWTKFGYESFGDETPVDQGIRR